MSTMKALYVLVKFISLRFATMIPAKKTRLPLISKAPELASPFMLPLSMMKTLN